jgi:hypothetical protein
MTFAFPQAACESVEQALLDQQFLERLSIVPESVRIDGAIPRSFLLPVGPSLSDISLVQEELHLSAMPDPPQNVREQLAYTIRQCDLKPVYKDSGPQLIQNHCSGIESKTQTSIQFEQRSVVVEFHVAGLEEDVARAMHLIQEEFEELRTSSSSDEENGIEFRPPSVLTMEALQEHEAQTSPKEVRQFSCRVCLHDWWRVVPAGKPVSRCNRCNTRYDALPLYHQTM